MLPQQQYKLVACPVCSKKYLSHTMSKHIVQQGQREIYKVYSEKGHVGLGSEGKPHEDFVVKNKVTLKKFIWK